MNHDLNIERLFRTFYGHGQFFLKKRTWPVPIMSKHLQVCFFSADPLPQLAR